MHLSYLLFDYRVSAQASRKKSPFFLLYRRDARLPTETVLSQRWSPYLADADDYKSDLLPYLSITCKLATKNIQGAQNCQKSYKDIKLAIGDQVMVYMSSS